MVPEQLTPATGVDLQVTSASEPTWAVEPTGKPEEFGFSLDLDPRQKKVWGRQEVYLAAYAEYGQMTRAVEAVGLSMFAPHHWERHDIFGFRARVQVAHQRFCDRKIEAMIADRLEDPQGNRGSDILLMFRAKAEMPEKYREEVKIVDSSATKDLLQELRRLGRPRVVEGSLGPAPEEPTTD